MHSPAWTLDWHQEAKKEKGFLYKHLKCANVHCQVGKQQKHYKTLFYNHFSPYNLLFKNKTYRNRSFNTKIFGQLLQSNAKVTTDVAENTPSFPQRQFGSSGLHHIPRDIKCPGTCLLQQDQLGVKLSHTDQFKSISLLTLGACRVCDHQRRNWVTRVVQSSRTNGRKYSGGWFNQTDAISSANEPSASLTSIMVGNSEHTSNCINTILPWIGTKRAV